MAAEMTAGGGIRRLSRAYQLESGERVLLAGCSKAVAERTRDGAEVIEFLVGVMRGARYRWPELHPKELPGLAIRPTPALRQAAAEWLADRLWGRAVTVQFPVEEAGAIAGLEDALRVTPQESAFLEAARALAIQQGEAGAVAGDLDRSVNPQETT